MLLGYAISRDSGHAFPKSSGKHKYSSSSDIGLVKRSMRLIRWVGVAIVIIGILLLLDFFSKQINSNILLADVGLLTFLLGCLLVGVDGFSRKVKFSEKKSGQVLMICGWLMLSSGLLVGLLGFLLENQVMCSCPASGPCYCGVLLYRIMLYAGSLVAVIGAGLVTAGTIQARETLAYRRILITLYP
jgi:hypothetical protein